MSKLFPRIVCGSVLDITEPMLTHYGVRGLLIDIDNTLTHHNDPAISPAIRDWITTINTRFPIILFSNNHENRVQPFAKMLNLPYISDACKPALKAFVEAGNRLNIPPQELAVIGDQIFTDVLGGNRIGAVTIRVEPMHTEPGFLFQIKRVLEVWVMKRYYKKRGK